jgi:hypothetical protein
MTRTKKWQLTIALLIIVLGMLACNYSTAGMNNAQFDSWIHGATWTPEP